jgi:hypothetical protein
VREATRRNGLVVRPAPRSGSTSRLHPRFSREEFEGRFLGLMPYLDPKGKRDESMSGNHRPRPGVRNDAVGDPRGMAKAELPEP